MKRHPMQHGLRIVAALAALLLAGAAAQAATKTITLPPDSAQLKPSPLPGYAKAQGQCVACHSAEYMLYQPPTAARPYWEAMVKRMKAVFKASRRPERTQAHQPPLRACAWLKVLRNQSSSMRFS
jgi:mono/diheme cytochrome c family protein